MCTHTYTHNRNTQAITCTHTPRTRKRTNTQKDGCSGRVVGTESISYGDWCTRTRAHTQAHTQAHTCVHTHVHTQPHQPQQSYYSSEIRLVVPHPSSCPCLALLQIRGLEGLGSVPALRRTQGDTRPTGRCDSSCQGRAGGESCEPCSLPPCRSFPENRITWGWSTLLELAARPQLCSRQCGLRVYCKLGQQKEVLVNITGKLQNRGFSIQTWSGTFTESEGPRA